MANKEARCPVCGNIEFDNQNVVGGNIWWKCKCCGANFTEELSKREYEKLKATLQNEMGAMVDEAVAKLKLEKYENLRLELCNQVRAKYMSGKDILKTCKEILAIYPSDPLAKFFEVAHSDKPKSEIAEFIGNINPAEYTAYIELILDFVIRTFDAEYINSTSALLEKFSNFFVSPEVKQNYYNRFKERVTAIEKGTYEISLNRDVFVAYASDDIDAVQGIVEFIEKECGLTCFVAYRNLDRGIDAKGRYEDDLHIAIDHCTIFLLVSSVHSRDLRRDPMSVELNYVRNRDLMLNPGYVNNYQDIPERNKKLRIQYRLDNKRSLADPNISEFFSGCTWAEDYDQLLNHLNRCMTARYLPTFTAPSHDHNEPKTTARATNVTANVETEAKRKVEEKREIKVIKQKTAQNSGHEAEYSAAKQDFYIEGRVLKKYSGIAKEILLPDSVTTIGDYAFSKCTNLTKVIIPNCIKTIGKYAFEGCTNLKTIILPKKMKTILEHAFERCINLDVITIPDGVTTISDYTFDGCTNLVDITISNSVTSIGKWAFHNCESLSKIDIPDSVTSIGNAAFLQCKKLTHISVPNSVTTIDTEAFKNCTSLTEITIPGSVKRVGAWAFYGCPALTIFVPQDADTFAWREEWNGDCSVYELATNRCLILGDREKKHQEKEAKREAEEEAKRQAEEEKRREEEYETKLQNAKAQGFVIANGVLTKYTAAATEVIIPDVVTIVGSFAFYYCRSLTNITIPDSVTTIENNAFSECSSLTDIIIPDSVTTIGSGAFSYCSSLTDITIPAGVTTIGNGAFSGCSSLTNITLPDGVTTIGYRAFYGCSSLTNITIPDSVTTIEAHAFQDCISLTGITIPNSVTTIGEFAFHNCRSLTDITIMEGVTTIGGFAFGYCSSLTNIIIPNSVTTIGAYAFNFCGSLTNITIPNSVTTIGEHAFGTLNFELVVYISRSANKSKWHRRWNYCYGGLFAPKVKVKYID